MLLTEHWLVLPAPECPCMSQASWRRLYNNMLSYVLHCRLAMMQWLHDVQTPMAKIIVLTGAHASLAYQGLVVPQVCLTSDGRFCWGRITCGVI